VRAAVLVLRDVTEQRASEQKLLSAEKHASVSSLAAGVAHEFKNYLGGIMGNAGLAQQVAGDQEVIATAMQRILEIGARANQTALSLLSYVQETGDEPQALDLGNLAGEVICLMEQRAAKQGIQIERTLALDVCIQGMATKVRQIILNLLNNAVEAMPDGGTLYLTVSGDPVSARLEIKDTGIGIPPQNLGRVFDPFFSTKGVWGREAGAGTGLGLTTSSNYVRELGGDLVLDSTPGEGTQVGITFPRVHRQGSGDQAAFRADIPKSVIILETDPEAREVLAKALISRSWQVTIAAHAQELQAALASGVPGVAFLDALMPGKLNFIRAFDALIESAPKCRVVVTTGAATDYQLLEYIQAAAGRLVKPLSNEQVAEFIETQLSGAVPS
jgi:nitrogen-specific signal transduction histidine kinase